MGGWFGKGINKMNKLNCLDIEIAIMSHCNYRSNIIVPNVSWGIAGLKYECDLVVLSKSNYATEIEIKTSKQDLIKDKSKKHYHDSNLFKYLYFAVPTFLVETALAEIPNSAGLYSIYFSKNKDIVDNYFSIQNNKYDIDVIRSAKINKECLKWTDKQRIKLLELGCMRICGLKEKIRGEIKKYE